jgi:hypothetical protein
VERYSIKQNEHKKSVKFWWKFYTNLSENMLWAHIKSGFAYAGLLLIDNLIMNVGKHLGRNTLVEERILTT